MGCHRLHDRPIFVRRNLPSRGEEKAPKSQKIRSVRLVDQAAVALDGLSRREHFTGTDDRVFCSATGGAFDDDELRDEFYAALGRAELGHLREKDDPIVFHDLLHTFETLSAAIWPLHDLQGYMGRADIQTAMIYVHHVPNVTAADELSRAVKQAMGVATAAGVEGAETAFAQAASDTIHPTADHLERNGSRALRSGRRACIGGAGTASRCLNRKPGFVPRAEAPATESLPSRGRQSLTRR